MTSTVAIPESEAEMGGEIEPIDSPGEESDEGVMLESIPKEAGLFLILIGIGGLLIPGPVGTPFLILGGLVFFPEAFRKFDRGLRKRFPISHRKGMKQVHRFVVDLERRYPTRA